MPRKNTYRRPTKGYGKPGRPPKFIENTVDPFHRQTTEEYLQDYWLQVNGSIKYSRANPDHKAKVDQLIALAIELGLPVSYTKPVGDGRTRPTNYIRRTLTRISRDDVMTAVHRNSARDIDFYASELYPDQWERGEYEQVRMKLYPLLRRMVASGQLIKRASLSMDNDIPRHVFVYEPPTPVAPRTSDDRQ